MKPQETHNHKGIDEDVVVVPYDLTWPFIYDREAETLRSITGVLGTEHVGSTSVPCLSAKPIIDILVGVQDLELSQNQEKSLLEKGYEGFGEQGVAGRLYFRKRGAVAFNLAVTIWNGPLWNDNVLLRDYLRCHPQVAIEYAAQKQNAIATGATRLLTYSDSKAAFVQALLSRAREWRPS